MMLTSISARGVRADTESTQIRSMAPDLHIRSATEITNSKNQYISSSFFFFFLLITF